MSTSKILQQLEMCAQILTDPPNNISVNDRKAAEDVFLNFQKTKSPFTLCREIMETTQNQFVLFQIGACLKSAIIREWSSLGVEQSRALFDYLFDYINRRPLDNYVIEELMLVNGIIIKRIHIEELKNDQCDTSKTIISSIFSIMKNSSATVDMRINACIAIIRILSEYSTLTYNSDYGLSWYSHLNSKRSFERKKLKDIFSGAIEILYEQVKMPEEIRRMNQNIRLNCKLIRICEIVLCWNMESISLISDFLIKARDRVESPVFNPPRDWLKFIIDSNLISFFFEMFLSFRFDPQLLHGSLICLTQLSTMVSTRHEMALNLKFSETFMQNTITICNILIDTMTINEVHFISNLFDSICIHLRSLYFDEFNPTLLRQFIDIMIKFTCKILLKSIEMKENSDEEFFDKCNQSIELLMHSIMNIANMVHFDNRLPLKKDVIIKNNNSSTTTETPINQNKITSQELSNWTNPLFETFLRVHLSQPEGMIPLEHFKDDDDEIQEFEENDVDKYREQMVAIGLIAQVDLRISIDLITKLMIMKLQQFEACIIATDLKPDDKMLQWIRISEDIHWILMISTSIFTPFAEYEIPEDVVHLSIKFNADIQSTLNALQNGDFNRPNIDPIVRYFIVILKLIQMEKQLLENQMIKWISPQVSLTLSIFISRFMHSYLAQPEYDDNDQSVISFVLNSCFGFDSPNVKNLINFFLDHMETKFLTMSSETQVLELSSEGLRVFCKFRGRIKILQECASLHRLLQRFPIDSNFKKLNNNVRRNMYNVFIIVFSENINIVIDPLIQLYQTFREYLRAGQRELIQEEFLIIVDFIMGISSGTTSHTFTNVWEKFVKHFYIELPDVLKIMNKCSIVVQAILELLFHFSTCFSIYFKDEDSLIFYKTAVSIFNEYALHTKDIYSIDSTRLEEIQCEFISILKFLNDLANQDVILFFINPAISYSSLNQIVGQVVITSLNIIMPLINNQLLENRKLCDLYYKLLEFIAQDSERFKGFPIKLFENYIKCVEYAFVSNNISNDIKAIGFKILSELSYQSTEQQQSEEMSNFLRPFFRIIIEFIFCELIKNKDFILRDAVALALYSLIRCFRQSYQILIRNSMKFLNDPLIEEQICISIFSIVDEVGFGSRFNVERLTFKKKFTEFINKLHTMLN